jgi:pimeloyl-ACP methyl ester carboxylesterase
MNPIAIGRESASGWTPTASYPLDFLTILKSPRRFRQPHDTVILVHGHGGDRTNLLAMSTLLRMAGFERIGFFGYSTRQPVEISASRLAEMAARANGGAGVRLVGHSLGGTIARLAAACSANSRIRSLVTLGSPYSPNQQSPGEVAIFGSGDPIVWPPPGRFFPGGMFKRVVVLRNTGHLGLLHHDEAIRITLSELAANRLSIQ